MKLSLDTKTKKKLILGLVLALSLNFLQVLAATDPSVDDLNAQKNDIQSKLIQLNQQITSYNKQIAETRKKSNTLKNEVLIYDKEIALTELQIQAKETRITDTNLQISELEKLIEQKIKEISENKKILASLIIQLNEFDNEYEIKTTLAANNLSDFLNQIQYTHNFQDRIYQLVQKIKDLKARLEAQEKDLRIQLAKLEELKEGLEVAKKAQVEQRDQKQRLLNQTRGLEQNYQKLLSLSQKEEASLEKEIADLDAQIRAKLGKKTISASKGVLAWPIDGILTQSYGNTGFTALGYNFHNGIDVAAPAGEAIYAAADGQVLYTDSSDASYGNWVAIKHTITTKSGSSQIITLYAHLRSFKVKPGQQVQQGDLIGFEGNTGNTTKRLYGPERGYHIHFGVYDAEGFGVVAGKYSNIYGPYKVPFGYTYNPLDFL